MDAAENSQNPLERFSVAHGYLLEQVVLAYFLRVIISDMYGSARDYVQLSHLREISRDVFRRLAIFTCWRDLHLVSAELVKTSC